MDVYARLIYPLVGWGRSGGPGWVFSFFFVWFTHLWDGGAQVGQFSFSLFGLPTYGMGALRLASRARSVCGSTASSSAGQVAVQTCTGSGVWAN